MNNNSDSKEGLCAGYIDIRDGCCLVARVNPLLTLAGRHLMQYGITILIFTVSCYQWNMTTFNDALQSCDMMISLHFADSD